MIEIDRIRGGIYGLLLGDAAGVPYEFHPPGDLAPFADRIDMAPPPGFRRAHPGVPVGTWSDDGTLALCLLESLVDRGGHDPVDQARRMVAWLDEGHLAVDGCVFDVGITTAEALATARALLAEGASPVGRGPAHERSAGNGTLMRILPLALLDDGEEAGLARRAMEHSALTHAHPLCLACCGIYCLWARRLAGGAGPAAFDDAVAAFRSIAGDEPAMAAALRTIEDRGRAAPTGTGFVVDTLHSARWALDAGPDFKAVIRRAIRLGHDTDTTAAVAGGLAGLRAGELALPADWFGLLRGQDLVEPILARLRRGG